MGTAHSYIRLTVGETEDSDAVVRQKADAEAYFRQSLQPQGIAWGGHYVDAADTRPQPLSERPEGRKMSGRLARGDHVIIAKFACGFRDTKDFLICCRCWATMDVMWSAIDLNLLEMGAQSVAAFEVLRQMAAADSVRHGERLRLAHSTRKSTGRVPNQHAGYGFRLEGPKGRKRRVVDETERRTMARIVELRESGKSWYEIARILMLDHVTRNGREWGPSTVRRAYLAELALRQAQDQAPTKRCRRCGQHKPLDVAYFHHNSTEDDGFHRACKSCRSAERKELRAKKRKKRRTAVVDNFRKAAKSSSLPNLACAQVAETVGGHEQLAEAVVDEFHDAKPGGQRRISLLQAVMQLAMEGGGEQDDKVELPGTGT